MLLLILHEALTVISLVDHPAQTMLSMTLTPMVSFSIGFLGYLSILRISLCPLGCLTALSVGLSSTKFLSFFYCSLDIIYFSLQRKYWVLYLGVYLEIYLFLDIFVLKFCLLHEIF